MEIFQRRRRNENDKESRQAYERDKTNATTIGKERMTKTTIVNRHQVISYHV